MTAKRRKIQLWFVVASTERIITSEEIFLLFFLPYFCIYSAQELQVGDMLFAKDRERTSDTMTECILRKEGRTDSQDVCRCDERCSIFWLQSIFSHSHLLQVLSSDRCGARFTFWKTKHRKNSCWILGKEITIILDAKAWVKNKITRLMRISFGSDSHLYFCFPVLHRFLQFLQL